MLGRGRAVQFFLVSIEPTDGLAEVMSCPACLASATRKSWISWRLGVGSVEEEVVMMVNGAGSTAAVSAVMNWELARLGVSGETVVACSTAAE